jgi:hypothetical protein
MNPIQSIKLKSIAHNTLIILASITVSMTLVSTDALAVDLGGGGAGHGGGAQGGGHIDRGFGGPIVGPVPTMPPPILNPSYPYTLPESPEIPVSPASPGSIFGNG